MTIERVQSVGQNSYNSADHAKKYRSTAGTQAAMDQTLRQRCIEDLDRDGYTIVKDVFDADVVRRIRSECEPLFRHAGRNAFEGYKTRRLYSPLDETEVLDQVVEHPIALGLLDALFQPNYLLSQLQVIDIAPGEAAQALHYDDSFYPWPRPRPHLGAATIISLDDFTPDNGATRVIPGSHRWGERIPTPEETEAAVPAVMPAGSMLFFLGTTWHSGGQNRSDHARMAVTAQYCAPWCRPQESFLLSVSRERVAASSEHMRRLLGYSIHPPFMGFVNGMHPKRVLEAIAPSIES